MGLKVRLTNRAITDLAGIREYLVVRNPAGAEHVRQRIDRTITALSEMPGIGHRTRIRGVYAAVIRRYP